MKFTVEVEGEVQLDRAFNRVKNHIEDLRPVWKEVQPVFFEIMSEQFQSEGAKGASGRWKPLKPKYEEMKAKRNFISEILVLSGALEASLTGKGAHSVEHFGKQEAAFGTDLPYARAHQTGGKRLPQRKIIDLSEESKKKVQKAIQKGLLKIIKGDSSVKKTLVVDETNFGEVG